MQRSLVCLFGLCMGLASANPSPFTLTWSAQESGSALCLADGTPLASGQKVRLGYFDISPQEIQSHFTQPAFLAAHFHMLAEAEIGSFESQTFVGFPELSTSGVRFPQAVSSFASSIVFTPSPESTEMDGKRCYVWAMDAATAETSVQHGIFSHSFWVLNLNTFGTGQWDLSQVAATNPDDVLLGSRGPQISAEVGGTVLRMTNISQESLDQADDDQDGAIFLLETAFAMDPTTRDSQKLPQIVLRNARPCLEFERLSGGQIAADGSYTANGLRYIVETSQNLQDWLPYDTSGAAVLTTVPGSSPDTEAVSIQLQPASETADLHFARVRIERIP